MARTAAFDSESSGFFINTVDNVFLDTLSGGYAVLGGVSGDTALVDAMITASCSLSPVNFNPPAPLSPSPDCVPEPKLVVSGALQTQ